MEVVEEAVEEVMEDARTIELFGKNIPVRKYGCRNYQMKEPLYITVPRVNLFIQTTNFCNANCPFCIYHGKDTRKFNLEKLEMVLKEIRSKEDLDLGKLNFTGGEPTLNHSVRFDELCDVCESNIRNDERRPEVTLNTNGFNLEAIIKHQDFLDSVGLSRHHYLDEFNMNIFDSALIPSASDLKDFMRELRRKDIIQLRCNLIKGQIDDYGDMVKYLEHSIDIGILDCGFVTLAPNNQYCKDHQVDFNSLVQLNKEIIRTNYWNRVEDNDFNKVYCECANYVYSNSKGQMCKFYARLFCNNDNSDGMLVYDGQNLRHGFGGEIII